MIKVRGLLLSHAHSSRGALLQDQASQQSLPRFTLHTSLNILLASRGFRGFLFIRDGENHDSACRSLPGRSSTGSKHRNILALWSFESKSPYFDHAARLTTKGLHTSTGKKLTTSELIKSLQLAKCGGSKTDTSNKALVTDECSEGGRIHESSTSIPKNLKEECKPDVGVIKKPLSKLIPQHVVDMGFAKKESFSKKQDQQGGSAESLQKPVSKQNHRIPVLHLESVRNDAVDESRPIVEVGANQGNWQKPSNRQLAIHIPELSRRGKKIVTPGSVKRQELAAAAFDTVPSRRKTGDSNLAVRQVAQHGEGADVPGKKHSVIGEVSRKQTQGLCESAALTRKGRQLVGKPNCERKNPEEMQLQSHEITRPGATSPNLWSQQESESVQLAGESSAKQEFVHVESRELINKQHACTREEAGMESQSDKEIALSNKQSKLLGRLFSVGKGNTNSQHTEHERVDASEHFVEGKPTDRQFPNCEERMGLASVGTVGMQSQHLGESKYLAKENTLNSSHVPTSTQPMMDKVRQHRPLGERENPIGSKLSFGSGVTERQPSLHQKSSNGVCEGIEIAGKQLFDEMLSTSSQCQNLTEGGEFISQQDMHVGVRKAGSAFDRWVSDDPLPDESMPPAARKPFDRNRPRRKNKNELLEKDLSVKPIPGEPHYEYLIRRKQVRAEAQKALVDDVGDYEHVGDDWMRKRLGWLCKEIPVLKASGLVKMLNNQRKWIKQEHLKELIEHLVRYMELNRAHRVLKWMQQQPFYEFEYELHNNMAFILGRNDKLSRCQDVFDEIVRNGQFPDASVFTALIKAYLNKGDQGDINDAWKLYKQMLQLGLTASESLSETLLKSLTCPTGRWIQEVEELFAKMKASGMYINEEMYNRVMDIYGKRGDHKKFDVMMNELKNNHVKPTVGILNAKLETCIKDGNTVRAEHAWSEIVELGLKPDWRSYAHLIQVYGKANMPMQSWEAFEKMKGISIPINFVTYHAIIEAMAADGQHEEQVMEVLKEVEECGIKPLQPFYNSVMNMYLRLKKHDEVESIYNRGKVAKVRPAHAAYNMLMKAYTESGQLDKAEALFQEMKVTEGMGPNTHTYNILLEGYGVGLFKERVRELFEEMLAKGCQLDPDVKERIKSMVSEKRIVVLEKKKLILTDEQREIIPGLLLGGAKMESPDRNRTYELHLEFNSENEVKKVVKDRLSFLFQAWWKPNPSVVLNLSAASTECEEAPVEDSATKSLIQLETVSHGSFRFYAHQYRPNGEPAIPKLIHRWLKPRTLAYWYMYGGRKCQRTGGIILNASKYSGKQIQLVVNALKARTMDCRRKKRRNGDVIRFEGRSATWLWKLMEPHILKAVKEQLKPEEIPIDLAMAEGTKSWDSQDQASSDINEVSSDEDDWVELEGDKNEEPMEILED